MINDQPGATVLVGGGSGLIGSALVSLLTQEGYQVRQLVRRTASSPHEVTWDPEGGLLPESALAGVSAVVLLSGAPIADKRWTPSRRRELLRSRTGTTSLVARRMADLGGPQRLVTASAVGIYADRGEEVLTETSAPGEGFIAELCQAWEASATPAIDAGLSVAHARTGLVLTRQGGALAKLMPLLRMGVAGPMGHGRQWWPWISLTDEIRALRHLVSSEVAGPVNLTSPEPLRNAELTRILARSLNRPATIPAPAFALQLALGGFAAELLASQRVLPQALLADGFDFAHPSLASAAGELLERPGSGPAERSHVQPPPQDQQ